MASLSCYDEVIYDGDQEVNAMAYQLELFHQVVYLRFLIRGYPPPMILFLNKKDLFAEKIKRVPLSKCKSLDGYNGDPDSFEETSRYIAETFTTLHNEFRRHMHEEVYPHFTCATDQDHMGKVLDDVAHIVITRSLARAGFV